MANPRNYRRVSTGQAIFRGKTADGRPIEIVYSTGSARAHDEDCSQCGQTYVSLGMEGLLNEFMFGELCPECMAQHQEE